MPDQHYADPHDDKRITKAVQLCEGCPVLRQCRTFALANAEELDIWGGLTERARRRPRRREQRQRDKYSNAA